MYYTLFQLKESIERKIEQLGENAPCAAFIFNELDVITMDDEGNEVRYPRKIAEDVLMDVGESDYIYEQVFEIIEDSIKMTLKNQNNT